MGCERGSEHRKETQRAKKDFSAYRLLVPDPVHHEGSTVLEDLKVIFRHTLRGIQEQVEVQVTRALDLDFTAQVFWRNVQGEIQMPTLSCSLGEGLVLPASPSVTESREASLPHLFYPGPFPATPTSKHSPFFFWVGLVAPSTWEKERDRAGATSSGKS